MTATESPPTATRRPFAHAAFAEPRPLAILRRIIVPLVIVHVLFALWSGYRAIVQVFGLDLRVTTPVLHPGSAISFDVSSSGRVTVTVRLELIQGTRAETLAVHVVRTSRNATYDPFPKRASQSVVLTPEVLSHFTPGAVTVRVTALGRPQWLRTPPPTVRETTATLAP